MNTKETIDKTESYIVGTYKRYPVALVKGEGCRVTDSTGKEYLDLVAGLAVNNLGHCHPQVVKAIVRQAATLLHVSNLYHIPGQAKLAELLVTHSFAQKVFFCNSGAEANEAAIKLVRKYYKDQGQPERYEIITFRNSFHGRTMATLTATGQEKFHKGFEPLLEGFSYAEFNNIKAVERMITDHTCAVMVEPIQGEGGVNIPSDEYLQELRALCEANNLLLIFDEVQTGIGRTGKLFAYEHFNCKPDIMTLAKGLAGGVPIGAMCSRGEIAASFVPGTHASTFGGNPLACAAGIATIQTIFEEDLLCRCEETGRYFIDKLVELKKKSSLIKDVRGKGLMIAMELTSPGNTIVTDCMEKGFLINCVKDTILRFLPPLIITKAEIDLFVTTLDTLLHP